MISHSSLPKRIKANPTIAADCGCQLLLRASALSIEKDLLDHFVRTRRKRAHCHIERVVCGLKRLRELVPAQFGNAQRKMRIVTRLLTFALVPSCLRSLPCDFARAITVLLKKLR